LRSLLLRRMWTNPVAFFKPGHHNDRRTMILPYHAPEVRHSVTQRSLHAYTHTYIHTVTYDTGESFGSYPVDKLTNKQTPLKTSTSLRHATPVMGRNVDMQIQHTV